MDLDALEAAVLRDPNVVEPYLVLADRLQQTGDPQGELIALEHAPERNEDLIQAFRRRVTRPLKEEGASVIVGAWHLGFARDAAIRIHADRVPPETTESLLRRVTENGATRLLERLSIETLGTALDGTNAAVERALAVRRPLLRVLHLRGTDRQRLHARWVSESFPNLQELSMRALVVRMGACSFDNLDDLTLSMRAFGETRAEEIASGRWPRLSTLTIDSAGILRLDPFFARPPPRLTNLGLSRASHEEINAMIGSTLCRRLTVLRINGYNESALVRLVAAEGSFPALRRLELTQAAGAREAAALGRRGIQIRIVE